MFAIVRTGGKQYRVAAGDKIVVEKIDGDAGAKVSLGDILLAGEGADLKSVAGLMVSAEIIAQAKADKVIVFKKRRRHNYRRKNGHRQQHTILRILSIGDEKKEAKAKPAAAAAAVPLTEVPAAQVAPMETQVAPASVAEVKAPARSRAAKPLSDATEASATEAPKPAARVAKPKPASGEA